MAAISTRANNSEPSRRRKQRLPGPPAGDLCGLLQAQVENVPRGLVDELLDPLSQQPAPLHAQQRRRREIGLADDVFGVQGDVAHGSEVVEFLIAVAGLGSAPSGRCGDLRSEVPTRSGGPPVRGSAPGDRRPRAANGGHVPPSSGLPPVCGAASRFCGLGWFLGHFELRFSLRQILHHQQHHARLVGAALQPPGVEPQPLVAHIGKIAFHHHVLEGGVLAEHAFQLPAELRIVPLLSPDLEDRPLLKRLAAGLEAAAKGLVGQNGRGTRRPAPATVRAPIPRCSQRTPLPPPLRASAGRCPGR